MKKLMMSLVLVLINAVGYSQTAEEYFYKGLSKHKLGDDRGAILDYTKAIAINPNNDLAYLNRGLARLNLDQKESGCLDLSKAGELGHEEAYKFIKEYCN